MFADAAENGFFVLTQLHSILGGRRERTLRGAVERQFCELAGAVEGLSEHANYEKDAIPSVRLRYGRK